MSIVMDKPTFRDFMRVIEENDLDSRLGVYNLFVEFNETLNELPMQSVVSDDRIVEWLSTWNVYSLTDLVILLNDDIEWEMKNRGTNRYDSMVTVINCETVDGIEGYSAFNGGEYYLLRIKYVSSN